MQVVRLHDTRHGGGKPSQATNTRATNGVTVDPSSDFRIAGHGDNQVRTNQNSVLLKLTNHRSALSKLVL